MSFIGISLTLLKMGSNPKNVVNDNWLFICQKRYQLGNVCFFLDKERRLESVYKCIWIPAYFFDILLLRFSLSLLISHCIMSDMWLMLFFIYRKKCTVNWVPVFLRMRGMATTQHCLRTDRQAQERAGPWLDMVLTKVR